MNTTPTISDDSFSEVLMQFEQELRDAPDPNALLERYRMDYPALAELLDVVAEAASLLATARPRPPGGDGAVQADALPARFGPYRVIGEIGSGGMGMVYKAIEEPLDRHVAIKTLRRPTTSAYLLARFERERRTLALLHHTNIVPIYATGAEGDLLYFAMPYLSGASLRQVIKTVRTRESSGSGLINSSFEEFVHEAHSQAQPAAQESPEQADPAPRDAQPDAAGAEPSAGPHHLSRKYIRAAVQVTATVAEGLHHAHQANVVHRDLKPGNILVENNGHAWVLDFGLAALRGPRVQGPLAFALPVPAAARDASLTAGPLGTPPYMAPEQLSDARLADARSDVWGLGATLYELLTLQRPFQDSKAVLEESPTPPRKLTSGVDLALDAVVRKALEKDSANRYPTAQALADDLNHWLRGEPISAWPKRRVARPAWRLCLWLKRNRGWAAAIALALMGTGLVVAFIDEQRRHAVHREQAVTRQLQFLDTQRTAKGEHWHGWSRSILNWIGGRKPNAEERGQLQALGVAALIGLDSQTEKTLPVYARSLVFATDGTLWMGATGAGAKHWNPQTDRTEEIGTVEVDGPLAIRPDGTVLQVGPTYRTPDRASRIPLDPRPDPRFPLQLLDVRLQKNARTLDDPIEGGSKPLAWTLSPGGSHVAALAIDGNGRQHAAIWGAETGRWLHHFQCSKAPESPALPRPGLAFAPDASLLATWDGSGRVDVWDVAQGRRITGFSIRHPITSLAFGPNHWLRESPRTPAARWMVAVGDSYGSIALWNPGLEGTWQTLRGHHGQSVEILSLAFSPDGTLLASAGRTNGELWDVAAGKKLVEFPTDDFTTALAFSRDGTRIACSSWSVFARPADRARTLVSRLEGSRGIRHLHGLPSRAIKTLFSRDGKRVAALSWDWWAGVWERDTGRLVRILAVPRGQSADNADLAFSPDGRRLAVAGGNSATLWNLESGETRSWTLPWALQEALAFGDDERLLLFRTEVKDGSRPPDSEAPAAEYPRVCVLRNLLGPKPQEPLRIIDDFAWGVQDIEGAPDGSCFVVEGRIGPPDPARTLVARVYDISGRRMAELPTQVPSDLMGGFAWFDSTGKFLVKELDVYEMPAARYRGPTPGYVTGVSSGTRYWVVRKGANDRFDLCDSQGNVLVERFSDDVHQLCVPFSPDLDGRFVLWGNPSGLLCLADLVEIQRRLTGLRLGW